MGIGLPASLQRSCWFDGEDTRLLARKVGDQSMAPRASESQSDHRCDRAGPGIHSLRGFRRTFVLRSSPCHTIPRSSLQLISSRLARLRDPGRIRSVITLDESKQKKRVGLPAAVTQPFSVAFSCIPHGPFSHPGANTKNVGEYVELKYPTLASVQ